MVSLSQHSLICHVHSYTLFCNELCVRHVELAKKITISRERVNGLTRATVFLLDTNFCTHARVCKVISAFYYRIVSGRECKLKNYMHIQVLRRMNFIFYKCRCCCLFLINILYFCLRKSDHVASKRKYNLYFRQISFSSLKKKKNKIK